METPLNQRIYNLLMKHGHTEAAKQLESHSPSNAAACSAFPLECCAETEDNFTVWAADKARPLYSFAMSERKTVESLVAALNKHVMQNSSNNPPEGSGSL